MKLIVGLGNPGSEYEKTRHNAGFLALDRVADRHARGSVPRSKHNSLLQEATIGGERVILLKPLTFMNRCGSAVAEVLGFYKMSAAGDLLVLVDDYALPLGAIRVRGEGSAGGHNGLSDIERALGTSAYPRLRIGIDPPPANYNDPADWVLGRFTDEQARALGPALDKAADAVEVFISKGVPAAMNRFNAKDKPAGPATKSPAQPQSAPKPSPTSATSIPPAGSGPAPGEHLSN
jgi:PTH1 family peptidyl-tRNA hydrolase